MRGAKTLLVSLLCIAFLQCSKTYGSFEGKALHDSTSVERSLIRSDNRFGFKLFREILGEEMNKNVFISPLSVAMALAMTYNGADGSTKEAMEKTLELGSMTIEQVNESYKSLMESLIRLDPKVRFEIANSIWYRKGLTVKEEFIHLNKSCFNALVTSLDFDDPKAADEINRWVNDNTKGKIKEIVDKPIGSDIVMFLINAIYFKGMWTDEFDKGLTRDDSFVVSDGKKRPCRMMNKDKKDFQYFENPDFQAISLPYGEGDFSMAVFLPRPGKNTDSLVAQLNEDNWNQWKSSFSRRKGVLQLPKFTLEYELELTKALKNLGMGIAFQPGRADFTGMYEGRNSLFISKVKHKTFVKVDEEGTEAAAVTSVEVGITSVGPAGFVMRVDRPFMFMIVENNSSAVLFMGKIVEPKS